MWDLGDLGVLGALGVLLRLGLGVWGCFRVRRLRVEGFRIRGLLEGSWVLVSGVRSALNKVVPIVALFISPLVSTHEPPSTASGFGG